MKYDTLLDRLPSWCKKGAMIKENTGEILQIDEIRFLDRDSNFHEASGHCEDAVEQYGCCLEIIYDQTRKSIPFHPNLDIRKWMLPVQNFTT